MSLIRKHVAVLQAWACLALVDEMLQRPCSEGAYRANEMNWTKLPLCVFALFTLCKCKATEMTPTALTYCIDTVVQFSFSEDVAAEIWVQFGSVWFLFVTLSMPWDQLQNLMSQDAVSTVQKYKSRRNSTSKEKEKSWRRGDMRQ